MQSVSALDLVSGALKSTLARAQKNYDFNSTTTIAKKKTNRIKSEVDNLECGSDRDKDFNYWNIAVKSNKLQFATSGYQLSNFIETIRSKYECLNPSEPRNSLKKNHHHLQKVKQEKPKLLVNNTLRGKSKSNQCGVENASHSGSGVSVENGRQGLQNRDKLNNKVVHQSNSFQYFNTDSKLVCKPNEIFEQLKERKKEVRRKKKEARKLARLEKLKAVEPNLFCPDKKENIKFLNSKNVNSKLQLSKKNKIMKEAVANSTNLVNGLSNTNQLSQPRVVLYPRNKVIPGWKTKLPIGCGLINLGNSCYMNASLQALFHTPAFVNWLLDDNEHKQNCRNSGQCFQSCIICAMYNTLRESLNRSNQCLRPLQIHNKLKVICKHFTHGRQEDAHEFLRYLLESMERSYLAAINSLRLDNRSKETTPLGQIFGGYLRTEVTCLKCNFISTTFQPLAELQLDIRHVTTLEDAIQNHFKKERLDNNDYKCEKCHSISPATKQFSLEIPPIVLCLQLKRFTLYGTKITKPIHCNRYLNLTRYLHKSHQEVGQGDIKYRLVALVTHMGSSPNCGHYTAIAEAANGNFYQFDDSCVRQVSVQTALNTDAYVIIYEMDRNQNQIHSASVNNSNFVGKPATVTSPLQTPTTSITANGNNNNLLRIGSPVPAPKKFTVPFLKSPVSENSSIRNLTMGSPSVPIVSTKISTINPFSTSNKQLYNNGSRFEWNPISKSPTNSNSLAPPSLADQQHGLKRKLDVILDKKDSTKIESKQPRLVTSIATGTDISSSASDKPNGVIEPVSSTSCWKVISNGKASPGNIDKQSENYRKLLSKTGGYSSDPETKLNNNFKSTDFHRAKSVERLFHSQNNKTVVSSKITESDSNSLFIKSPEKIRKSPISEVNSNARVFPQNDDVRAKDDSLPSSAYVNGHAKITEQKSYGDRKLRPESTNSLLLDKGPSSPSSSDSSSDELRKSKSKHKKKSKKGKGKRRKKKHHKRSSSSSSSTSSSESESDTKELLKKRHKPGLLKVIDKLKDRNKSSKKHKSRHCANNEGRSPHTTSTDLSEDGNRKQSKSNHKADQADELSSEIIRSMSEERERDRRKNRNPSRSRSPERKDVLKDNDKFDLSKLSTRDRQVIGWNGKESALSKSIDVDKKSLIRKSKDDLFDEEMDIGRMKKSRKSRSPSRDTENGSSVNKFQNYEDLNKKVTEWSKVSEGHSERNTYSEKGNPKGNGEYQNQKNFAYRSNSFNSGYSGSYTFHHGHRNNSQFRNGKSGRGNFGRMRHSETRNYHHNSFRRDNRDRRPS